MLNAAEDLARTEGWLVVSETASPGFVERITTEHLPRLLREFDPKAIQRRLRGVTAPLSAGAVTWDSVERHVVRAGLRSQLELLTELLAEHETGLLLTVDEIHRNQLAELREVATTLQHAFREGRDVAFIGAGLGSRVSDVVNDSVLTFLRRADRHHLGRVRRDDVERGFRVPIEASERRVEPAALAHMVDAVDGYPFMLQLVGSRVWRMHPERTEITIDDAREGVELARDRLGTLVHEPALSAASEIDRSFLLAMAQDSGPVRMADIAERLGVTANYASQYRRRLLAAELIEPVGTGRVDFALPYLREYLLAAGPATAGDG